MNKEKKIKDIHLTNKAIDSAVQGAPGHPGAQ